MIDEIHETTEKIAEADILVGIPSYNNACTIGHVIKAVQAGLAKYFPQKYAVGVEPVIVNLDRMIGTFKLGVRELIDIWKVFIPKEIIGFLRKPEEETEEFHIPADHWAEIIHNFALASRKKTLNKEHLRPLRLASLLP
jgi:hypothetical protein